MTIRAAMAPVRIATGVALLLAVLPSGAQTISSEQAGSAIRRYCATCHSAQLHTAGLVLDSDALSAVAGNAERWEKVIRKLRTRAMPPQGAARPDDATYDGVAAFLETALDRSAAVKPTPGKLPLLHRLTRTEYENTIRDLLDLKDLPKEMDYSLLLPPDNAMSGFDNIAELLFVSPTAMESYLNAAEKISRLAVGDPKFPVMVNIHRAPDEMPQTARVDALSFGTRGGLAIETCLPLDADYTLKVNLTGRSNEAQQLEVTVDGERVHLAMIGGAGGRGGARRAFGGSNVVEVRLPLKAGPRLIGVSFLERNALRNEDVLRPLLRDAGPEVAVETVTISGPYEATGPGDTPSRRRIFVCHPTSPSEEEPCARRILSALERRAFRRPVTADDVESLMSFYRSGKAEGGFEVGIERASQRLLVSPQFLFRIERDPAGTEPGTPHPVTDLELASRLSFFLWSSIPDDELLDVAAAGKLRQPGVLEKQVRRMLADSRSMSLVTNFAEQWLYLRDLDAKKPNEILFADFDESLREAFQKETVLFLDSILRGDRSVLDLLSANYTFVNERLAKHYGIPHVQGSYFRRVLLPAGSPRGGLLGQGSILTITSYANRTSPVNRGKWVLENLLSSPPPPPPPSVPALKTEGSEPGKTLTMREAMIRHRAAPACASCHARMDPIGFAMENFDAVGRWRDQDGGSPIDASGIFPDGVRFNGMAELKAALLRNPYEFTSTVAEKLLMYATGRNVQYFDEPAIREILRKSAADNYKFSSLVLGVVNSVPFQMREAAAAAGAEPAIR